MKKIIFSLIFLIFSQFAAAEELLNNRHYFNRYENPVYYAYMDDYMNLIGDKFGEIKYYRNDIFIGFYYKLNKDGTISDFRVDKLTTSRMNVPKLKAIVENTILPFYKGMDKDYVNINIAFFTNKYYDSCKVNYFPQREINQEKFRIEFWKKVR